MKYKINSYQGIGKIKFGMNKEEISNLLGSNNEEIVRTKGSNPVDVYESLGLYVYYNNDNRCVAIELATPCSPLFEGHDLLNTSFIKTVKYLKKYDPNIEINNDGFNSKKLGIGGYCPREDDNEKLESIICFKKDYYDEK